MLFPRNGRPYDLKHNASQTENVPDRHSARRPLCSRGRAAENRRKDNDRNGDGRPLCRLSAHLQRALYPHGLHRPAFVAGRAQPVLPDAHAPGNGGPESGFVRQSVRRLTAGAQLNPETLILKLLCRQAARRGFQSPDRAGSPAVEASAVGDKHGTGQRSL